MNVAVNGEPNYGLALVPTAQAVCRSQVVLGAPSDGCTGVGICRMYTHLHPRWSDCPSLEVWLLYTARNQLRLHFDKQAVNAKRLERHFYWRLFQVNEPYRLPHALALQLGIRRYTIKPGVYPVMETTDWLIVEF